MLKIYIYILFTSLLAPSLHAQNLVTDLIESTFRIDNPDSEKPVGTGFFLWKIDTDTTSKKVWRVLVTAHHVLDSIKGDYAIMVLRERVADDFRKASLPIRIRQNGVPLWINPKNLDLAIMYAPSDTKLDISMVSANLLARDEDIKEIGLYTGEELLCLGFPGGLPSNTKGYFPILRSGKIASYPIIPAEKYPDMYIDFEVFGGNSGGPVIYLSTHRVNKNKVDDRGFQYIMGMVTSQAVSSLTGQDLKLAIVIPAHFIRKAIEALPIPK